MGFELRQDLSSLETVNEFTKRMESTTEEAKSAIRKAQEDMTRYYNRRSLAPVFKPEDRVYLDAVTPLENFLRKCSMGYTLYPWISLLEPTLETSYKLQT